ncbi:winged helix-turn-helix domain-containing protein [Agromyces sp. NPDC057865]|uniref:winged helix-turn-helix domain-containing protein n=1 Tax=Agromyces sp. NPDC057865 TaxID=3346267 RepID=UPI00366F59B6
MAEGGSFDAPRLRAVPGGSEPRGFVLFVGMGEDDSADGRMTMHRLVDALRRRVAEVAPSAETHAAVAIAPVGAGGRHIDVVRRAMNDPGLRHRPRMAPVRVGRDARPSEGVLIDVSRRRVFVDGRTADVTFREFELLQYLIAREGRAVPREELIAALWDGVEELPSERTVDVHVRRLRVKLGEHHEVLRTVRRVGYQFERRQGVVVRLASTPSPDLF